MLFVDDSAFFRNLLSPLLSVNGYAVVAVDSADKALALRDKGEVFDAIISDIEIRITSYNVCYTKLLRWSAPRPHRRAWAARAPRASSRESARGSPRRSSARRPATPWIATRAACCR